MRLHIIRYLVSAFVQENASKKRERDRGVASEAMRYRGHSAHPSLGHRLGARRLRSPVPALPTRTTQLSSFSSLRQTLAREY